MKYPDIFLWVSGDSTCTSLLGTSPVRFWAFGAAPQNETKPYAVHQLVYGTPENTLSCTPDSDTIGLQIDAYAQFASAARSIATAIADVCEHHGYVMSWNGEFYEQDTRLYRVSFTVEFYVDRI